jgi:serine/threonine protein kinase
VSLPLCPSCSSEITEGARFCSGCGLSLGTFRSGVTREKTPSLSLGPTTRFAAGDILAGRYRIVERVGRGGMGEVYRADDLTLEQPVALKFLPAELATSQRLKRFRREVSIARLISHPNVCRVYDIGEAEGLVFLSMEYIDGEDLSSLLRRIGRLPPDKALEISREIASGLAVAHERGVLHRDLKPSNVMLDDGGRARITDLGLAAAVGTIGKEDVRSGTPAYMSPGQWAGNEVTEKSDIYSLGLVLYEIVTGKPPFTAETLEELVARKTGALPRNPSSLVEGLDPAVGSAILSCLELDPARRPASALAVRAALPGGDPLASAVARGETPAPDVVAEAMEASSLRPAVAWACLGYVLLLIPFLVWMESRSRLNQVVPLPKSPVLLTAEARQMLASLGYPPPRDTSYGFVRHTDYIDELMTSERTIGSTYFGEVSRASYVSGIGRAPRISFLIASPSSP